MSTKITFPIWRLADSTHKAEIQSLKATNLLIKFYQMKYEKQLQKLGFNLIFEKKTYSLQEQNNDPDFGKFHDKIYQYLNKEDNIFCSYVNRVYSNPRKTFSYKTKNKIIFTHGDFSWKEKIPSFMYDCCPSEPTNMEIVKWYSEKKNFKNIYFLHHEHSYPEKYKSILSKKNKIKFSSSLINSNEKNWENILKKEIKKVRDKCLLVVNLHSYVVPSEKFAEKFLKIIYDQKIKIDIIQISVFGDMSIINENEDINIIKVQKNPWDYYTEEKAIFQISPDQSLHEFFHDGDYLLTQFMFYSMVLDIIIKRKLLLNEKNFISKLDNAIKSYNGINDIFAGEFGTLSFKNRKNIETVNSICRIPPALTKYESKNNRTNILYPFQLLKLDDKIKTIDVHFAYVDILNIHFIDIQTGVWGVELNLELISKLKDPLRSIIFKNLSNTNYYFRSELISESSPDDEGFITTIYNLTANFSFDATATYYPFDLQDVFIEYALKDNNLGILQPVPSGQLDWDFKIEGWTLKRPYSTLKRVKNYLKIGTNLKKEVELKKVSRYGLLLKRHEPANLIKSLAPLSFLTLICYYCLLVPIDQIYNTIIFLITIFLAGIALYFSSDRPQPLSFSLIDKMFQFFYMIVGINILYALSVSLDFTFIKNFRDILIYLEPLFGFIFLIYIIKSKKDVEKKY